MHLKKGDNGWIKDGSERTRIRRGSTHTSSRGFSAALSPHSGATQRQWSPENKRERRRGAVTQMRTFVSNRDSFYGAGLSPTLFPTQVLVKYEKSLQEVKSNERKQPSVQEHVFSPCPHCILLAFPHCWWTVPTSSQTIPEGNPCCITLYFNFSAAELPLPPEESSWLFPSLVNCVCDVNYRMCVFVHTGACSRDDLCLSRKY